MPISWVLLLFSLVLGSRLSVFSLEKLAGSQDNARCSQGLSCHLWGDRLCLLGRIETPTDPVLVPTKLQTEVVLRCREKSNCVPCVRVILHLTVQGPRREDPEEGRLREDIELTAPSWPRNESLQANVILAAFQDYLSDRCVLVEVEVPAAMVQPGQNVGSLVFDCFMASVGGKVQLWSSTQPQYQKKLNHIEQLPDCFRPDFQDSVKSCWVLPWLNISVEGDTVQLVLDVSTEQNYVLYLYWNQTPNPSTRFKEILIGPQNITLNHTDLVPCLCIQMWPNMQDAIRNIHCPFQDDPRAHKNLWSHSKLKLWGTTTFLSWMVEGPCSLSAEMALCWHPVGGSLCHLLPLPLPRQNVTVNKSQDLPLLTLHPNICVQVWSRGKLQLQECPSKDVLGPLRDDMLLLETWAPQKSHSFCAMEPTGCTPLPSTAYSRAALLGKQLLEDLQSGQCMQLWNDTGTLWACSLQKYTHQRWVLVWLMFLVMAACILLLLLLRLNRDEMKDEMKGWLRFLERAGGRGGASRCGRRALLLYSPDHAAFERLVGALASALAQLPLAVAVDLWQRRELGALGPLAWFHAQRRRTLADGGVTVLLFSPGAAALCRGWPRGARGARGADTFAAALSCVLPDFQEGRAAGRYVVACFEGLLPAAAVPGLFRAVPVFSLPSQLPAFLRALAGPAAGRGGGLRARAARVGRRLRPALDECVQRLGASSSL